MINLLPIENLIYKTRLSKSEVLNKLIENIEKQKTFGFGTDWRVYSKPYIGEIENNSFEVKRAINYRNSFLPKISGEVFEDFEGTKIKIKMRPHEIIIAFLFLWFGIAFLCCLGSIYAMFTRDFNLVFLGPFFMILFGIVLLSVGFKTETNKSKQDFKKILNAEII